MVVAYRRHFRKQLGSMLLRNAARKTISYAAQKAKSYAVNKIRGTPTVYSGVSKDNDRTVAYVKKKAPRYLKRRLKRQYNNFNYQLTKRLATKTVIFNDQLGGAFTGAGQSWVYAYLYGVDGAADSAANNGACDVATILRNDLDTNETSERCMFSSAVLDSTFRNTGTTNLEVDMYILHAVGRRPHLASAQLEVAGAEGDIPTIGGAAPLTSATRGVTPFDLPMFLQFGWSIQKKVKYFVGSGDTFTYQLRDPKNRMFSTLNLTGVNTNCARTGVTKLVLFSIKQVPGYPGTTENAYLIGNTRNYRYKVLKENKLGDGVL